MLSFQTCIRDVGIHTCSLDDIRRISHELHIGIRKIIFSTGFQLLAVYSACFQGLFYSLLVLVAQLYPIRSKKGHVFGEEGKKIYPKIGNNSQRSLIQITSVDEPTKLK